MPDISYFIMIKSLLENGTQDEQTKEYIKELDLSLAERELSTKRIDRYRTDLKALKKDLAVWRDRCIQVEKVRDENYRKYKDAQRDLQLLEDEIKAKRDRDQSDRLSQNLSAGSSMVGEFSIPPPPPPPAIDEIFDMTSNNHPSSYLNDRSGTNASHISYNNIPPPPPLPKLSGDLLLGQSMAKVTNGFPESRTNVAGHNGYRV